MNTEIKERIVQIQNGEIPEGYKMSKVGIIPEEWDVYTVRNMITDNIIEKPLDGNHGNIHPKASDYVEEGIPFLLATDIEDNCIDLINCKKISFEQAESLQKGFAKNGDILLTHKGTVGNVAILDNINLPYVMLTPQVTYYRVKDNTRLYNIYLGYYFKSQYFQKQLKVTGKGATRDYIGIVQQQRLNCVLPSVPKQQRIATILSTQDKIIELKEKLLAEKKRQKQYLMQVLLNPNSPHFKRLPRFSGEWDKVKLGTVIEEIRETSTENNQYTMLTSSQNGLLLQRDYFKKSVASEENIGYKIIRAGDFTFRSMSDTGFFKINRLKKTEVGIVSPAYSVFSVIKANKDFMEFLFDSHRMTFNYSRIAQGGTRLALKLSALKRLSILLPKEDEQTKIADLLLNIASEIELFKQEIGQQKQKKKALMQLLLTGKVRVKV